jgi:hypothetical protein
MSPQHSEYSHNISKREIWIRAGGKCECTAECDHHGAGRCGIVLLPEFWSAREILPEWIGASKTILMAEALCEACRLNPSVLDHVSDESKRANPNWWYSRKSVKVQAPPLAA